MEHHTHSLSEGEDKNKKKGFIYTPILLALIVIAGVVLFINYMATRCDENCKKDCCGTEQTDKHGSHGDTKKADEHSNANTDGGTEGGIKLTLKDGKEMDVDAGGIEDKLVQFFNSDWSGISEDSLKKTWFNFDHLNFETGSSKITTDSQKQIDNIAAIMKAYPNAKVKIGGYTDKVGNESSNVKLSNDRANAVKDALLKAGVDSKQINGAEGYGSQFAKYPATASEEERATDRRISLSPRK